MRVVLCCVLVHTGNASKRGTSVVGPTVLVDHRLKLAEGGFSGAATARRLCSRSLVAPQTRQLVMGCCGEEGRADVWL